MTIRFEYVPVFAPRCVLQMEFSALFDQGLRSVSLWKRMARKELKDFFVHTTFCPSKLFRERWKAEAPSDASDAVTAKLKT